MIENLLEQSVFKNGHEVSFILGHKILTKSGRDWNEVKGDVLSQGEWEDLKDVCLQGNEKVQLETKGFVVGLYESKKHKWKFSFIERKDCFRAHLSLVKSQDETLSQIENPLFWDTVKKEKGLFIVAGERRQGKTALLHEILTNDQKNKISLVGIHSAVQNHNWSEIDSVVQLGIDTIDLDFNHILYEGVERIIIDTNSIKNWKKWIEIAEQGQCVILTLSSNSIKTIINKLTSELDESTAQRLFNILNGIVLQKLVGPFYHPCSEILIFKENQKNVINTYIQNKNINKLNLSADFKESYQSMNQAIIQKLIRRKIDVQAAFDASDDPETLDASLKKMGL
jgi:Tfp pilus assembly pilus retraction ATPase PilT